MKKVLTTIAILYLLFSIKITARDSTAIPFKVLGLGVLKDIAISPDGKKLASGSSAMIVIWDMETGDTLKTIFGHTGSVYSVSWSPDGKMLASGSLDGTIKLWDIISGKEIRTLKGHIGWVNSVSWSPDGKMIASGSSDNTIKLWDINSGKEIRTLKGHTNIVNSVSWSPDGKMLASGSYRTIKLWDINSGKEIRTLKGHTSDVETVSWSPDGKMLASGSSDNTIKLWDISTGKEIRTLKGHTGSVYSVRWSPGGKMLASGSYDNTIKLWDINSGKEILILNGKEEYMATTPSIPKDSEFIEKGNQVNILSNCWRQYVGKWEIFNNKLYLIDVIGKYKKIIKEPLFADWFSGTLKIQQGEIIKFINLGFLSVTEIEIYIKIKDGFVQSTEVIDNRKGY